MANIFTDLQPTPQTHFKVYFFAAVLQLIHYVNQSFGPNEAAFQRFPFLIGYNNELVECGLGEQRTAG